MIRWACALRQLLRRLARRRRGLGRDLLTAAARLCIVTFGSTRVGAPLDQRGVDSRQQSLRFGCTAPPGRQTTCGDFNRERRFGS
jgi:hypothetical protein